MTCGSCGIFRFGSRQGKEAMRLKHKEGISLKSAWAIVKRGRKSRGRKHKRRGSKRRGSKRRSKRKSRRRSRRFGIVAGPGFQAQVSYPNAYAPFFGNSENFVNPSEFYLPQTNGNIQSPQMLMLKPRPGYSGPGN